MEIMENPSNLEQNLELLSAEMVELKDLRDKVARREQKTTGWIKNVEERECVLDEIQKELKELKSVSHSTNLNARMRLNRKVINNINVLETLKEQGYSNSESIETLLSELESGKPKRFSCGELRRFTNKFISKINYGFGDVYKGQIPGSVQIAVKVLQDTDVVEEIFTAEVKTIGRTHHRNLVRLYGFCFEYNMKALVYEYLENGSLDKILYENQFHNIEWEKLYEIAIELAKGLAYLHESCYEQIIHYDVRACNVLLDSNFSPRITDFGLAKLINKDVTHVTLTRFRGIAGYAAPEMYIEAAPITCKCDVYSYGMMLFEILRRRSNGSKPWFPKEVWKKFEEGKLNEIIEECGIEEKDRENAEILSKVALWCAQRKPKKRPSMSSVVKMLEKEIPLKMPGNPFSLT